MISLGILCNCIINQQLILAGLPAVKAVRALVLDLLSDKSRLLLDISDDARLFAFYCITAISQPAQQALSMAEARNVLGY